MAKQSFRTEFEDFLQSLGTEFTPTIHVNGRECPTALVVVDFGAPLSSVRLNAEQNQELAGKLKKFAREFAHANANVRVSSDNYLGLVYWASVQ